MSTKINYMSVRHIFLSGFILINLIALVIMLYSGMMIGDQYKLTVSDSSILVISFISVISSYLLIMKFLFDKISNLKVRKIITTNKIKPVISFVGFAIFLIQFIFLLYILAFDYGKAGSAAKEVTSLGPYIWALIQPDLLFILSYLIIRNTKYFYPTLIIYTISSVVRGWSNIFAFIFFLEFTNLAKQGKITKKIMINSCVIILLVFPFYNTLKYSIRSFNEVSLSNFIRAANIINNIENLEIFRQIGEGIGFLVGRIQTVSHVAEVIRINDQFKYYLDNGLYIPFYHEGLFFGALYKIFSYGQHTPISSVFAYIDGIKPPGQPIGEWQINPGLSSWIYIDPLLTPILLLTIVFILFISIFLMKSITHCNYYINSVWIIMFLYLIPGWFGATFNILFALLNLVLLHLIASIFVQHKSLSRVSSFN